MCTLLYAHSIAACVHALTKTFFWQKLGYDVSTAITASGATVMYFLTSHYQKIILLSFTNGCQSSRYKAGLKRLSAILVYCGVSIMVRSFKRWPLVIPAPFLCGRPGLFLFHHTWLLLVLASSLIGACRRNVRGDLSPRYFDPAIATPRLITERRIGLDSSGC